MKLLGWKRFAAFYDSLFGTNMVPALHSNLYKLIYCDMVNVLEGSALAKMRSSDSAQARPLVKAILKIGFEQ
jgi:hypothetical protein